jgi:hypothetical protein
MSNFALLPEDKKKTYIAVGIIAVCLVGAVLGFVMLSGGDPANDPNVQAAIEKSRTLDQQMADQQPKIPDPPAPTAKSRSAVTADGNGIK